MQLFCNHVKTVLATEKDLSKDISKDMSKDIDKHGVKLREYATIIIIGYVAQLVRARHS